MNTTLPVLLNQFLGQRIFLTITAREEMKWGASADEPIGITVVEWSDALLKKFVLNFENYLQEERLLTDKKKWANENLICVALVGVSGTPKNPLSLFDDAFGFLFIDVQQWKTGDGPIMLATSDDWKLRVVAKSFHDLSIYANIKFLVALKK